MAPTTPAVLPPHIRGRDPGRCEKTVRVAVGRGWPRTVGLYLGKRRTEGGRTPFLGGELRWDDDCFFCWELTSSPASSSSSSRGCSLRRPPFFEEDDVAMAAECFLRLFIAILVLWGMVIEYECKRSAFRPSPLLLCLLCSRTVNFGFLGLMQQTPCRPY